MARSARALVEAWYEDKGDVVFDKGRFWNLGIPIFNQLFPDGHAFVCVRDLRDVFASIEKQHEKNPLLDEAGNAVELTKYSRADRMFSPNGMIGQQIVGIEDLLRRNLRNKEGKPFVHTIQYETFVQNPQLILDRVYTVLGEEPFEHDFDDVKPSVGSTDVDGLYNHKFPHEGVGKIEPRDEEWSKYVPRDVAGLIMQRFTNYNRAFGYQ
jgi:sulfotransferase